MNRICLSLLAVCLLAVGCTPMIKRPEPDRSTTTSAKLEDDAPVTPKLLPADQLNDKNARAQAQILGQTLKKENGQTESTGQD